ncbi:IS21 family transposase [Synechococcus sp. RSCCF101]|nr:IS21 family transposase [Synechococcus sp. RSCCF101]
MPGSAAPITAAARSTTARADRRGEGAMETPQEVERMLQLHARGLSQRTIAHELGCCPRTVRRYLRQGGWQPYGQPRRSRRLDEQIAWLREQFEQHRGNAEVLRQELLRQKGIDVSQRTVERAVAAWRRELRIRQLATVRYETPPGRQLQADFGQCAVSIGGERRRVHLCVLTLGYSRRLVVRPYGHERQANWLQAMEEAFRHWGGIPEQVPVDNARALVRRHDPASGELVFHPTFLAFAEHWGFTPRACRPYRPRTKGKDERGVRYVKGSGLAGHTFRSWGAMEAHLAWWMREVADVRRHGTTGERPLERFQRDEASALRPLCGKPSFLAEREQKRVVAKDCCIQLEGNWYSAPQQLIGQRITAQVRHQTVRLLHRGRIVAEHPLQSANHRCRQVIRSHWQGLLPAEQLQQARASLQPAIPDRCQATPAVGPPATRAVRTSSLARSLSDYAAVLTEVEA